MLTGRILSVISGYTSVYVRRCNENSLATTLSTLLFNFSLTFRFTETTHNWVKLEIKATDWALASNHNIDFRYFTWNRTPIIFLFLFLSDREVVEAEGPTIRSHWLKSARGLGTTHSKGDHRSCRGACPFCGFKCCIAA